jgi:hypothetical protein
LGIDSNQLTRKCLTVKGIHNYHPKHLGQTLKFLEEYSQKYPYDELVGKIFYLSEINDAVEAAASEEYIRIAVKPI